jgi:ribosome production factor 2
MAVMKRIVKPKTKRGTRALFKKESKAIENKKAAMFVRGVKCSQLVQDCMKDLNTLKKPDTIAYNKKNDIRPFEDAKSLEFYGKKMDASLFVFGSHNKKRPNNMTFGRLYDHHLLDMIEFGLDDFQSLSSFKNSKVAAGTKPCLVFDGEEFADTANVEMQRVKNFFIDFFRGPEVEAVRLAGLEHVLQFTSFDRKVFLRSYKVLLKKSGQRTPRIELEEIGPHIDLTLRRSQLASDDLFKTACKQVKNVHKRKKVKNITEDVFGTKHGRLHVQAQQIGTIQNRKIKALKESKEEKDEAKALVSEKRRQLEVEAVFGEED